MSSENISSYRSRSGLNYFHIFSGWKILSCSVDYSAYNENVLKQRMVCTNILTGDRTVNLTEFQCCLSNSFKFIGKFYPNTLK